MFKVIRYIKKNGIRRTIQVINEYKLDKAVNKLVALITKNIPLKDYIVIESHDDFDCNGGAFYDYLIEHGYNKKYKIIWMLKHKKPQNLPENVYAFKLHQPSFRKSYYASVAKYLTADNEVTIKVRDEQMSYYFDHGSVCLKNCKPFFNMSGKKIDYFFSPSENYDKIYCDQMSIEYPNDKMLYLGYPRHDAFFKSTPSELIKITKKKYNKVILWMPTFRRGGGFNRNDSNIELPLGIPLIDNKEMLIHLQNKLEELNEFLIIKIHPKQDMQTVVQLKEVHLPNIEILDEAKVKEKKIDMFHLLKNVDAMLSDYSSITYSFILLNKPIGYVFSDVNEYKLGFAMENYEDYVVGEKIYNLEEMECFLEKVGKDVDEYGEKRRKLVSYLYKYQDGDSCKRIVEFMGI